MKRAPSPQRLSGGISFSSHDYSPAECSLSTTLFILSMLACLPGLPWRTKRAALASTIATKTYRPARYQKMCTSGHTREQGMRINSCRFRSTAWLDPCIKLRSFKCKRVCAEPTFLRAANKRRALSRQGGGYLNALYRTPEAAVDVCGTRSKRLHASASLHILRLGAVSSVPHDVD